MPSGLEFDTRARCVVRALFYRCRQNARGHPRRPRYHPGRSEKPSVYLPPKASLHSSTEYPSAHDGLRMCYCRQARDDDVGHRTSDARAGADVDLGYYERGRVSVREEREVRRRAQCPRIYALLGPARSEFDKVALSSSAARREERWGRPPRQLARIALLCSALCTMVSPRRRRKERAPPGRLGCARAHT